MTAEPDIETRRREAAFWFARLNQKRVAASDISAFGQWRREPKNAAAFARFEALWEAADTLKADPDVAAMSADAHARAQSAKRSRARISRVLAPIGALAVLAAAVGLGLHLARPPVFETGIGETRAIVLADGSRVTLDTDSRMQVRLGPDRRRVDLVRGQAFFDVERDAERPFTVSAGETEVTAIGTAFGVRRAGQGARVTLVEGRVAVSRPGSGAGSGAGPAHWSLSPGEQVTTSSPGAVIRRVDAEAATSWRSGRLVFAGEPLKIAVAEINRYGQAKIVLEAPAVADIPVSGAFNTGDIEGFAAALVELYPVAADRSMPDRIVIRPSRDKSNAP